MRKAFQAAVTALTCLLLFLVCFPAMVLWPTRKNRLRWAVRFSRWWSRAILWSGGVELEVTGREHLATCPAVFTFNHSSTLDFVANAALAPEHALVFGKAELSRVPIVGWIWWLSGHPMIRRGARDQWQTVLDGVAARLATGEHTTIVSPEGTRNRQGGLLPFKKGPVHLAIQGRCPIVPWVLENCPERLGRGGLTAGPLRVRILPPIPTDGWREETIDAHVEALRGVYLRALGLEEPAPAPAAPAPGAAPAAPVRIRPPVA